MKKLSTIAKAIVGGLAASIGTLGGIIQAHGGNIHQLTIGDAVVVIGVFLAAVGLVHQTPNAQP